MKKKELIDKMIAKYGPEFEPIIKNIANDLCTEITNVSKALIDWCFIEGTTNPDQFLEESDKETMARFREDTGI